jgi:hypothetical protein
MYRELVTGLEVTIIPEKHCAMCDQGRSGNCNEEDKAVVQNVGIVRRVIHTTRKESFRHAWTV